MIPNIEDLTEPPVVGETYMVPAVWRFCGGGESCKTCERYWAPITGPMHSDAEYIGFKPMHFHYDLRFLEQSVYESLCIPGFLDDGEPLFTVVTQYCKERGIQRKEMVCLRAQREYPLSKAKWLHELGDAYTDKRVTCGKCPHRGLPLSSLPREAGTDIVTCPGHGLRFDLKTGCLVKGARP